MLQYDDSAFYFVAISFITIYLVPSWYIIIGKVNAALFTSDDDIGAISRTSAEKKKAAELKKTSRGFKTLNSPGFIVHCSFQWSLYGCTYLSNPTER
mmetsp:Transcript_20975/g.44272  ORF Transcript_20975/g.44272 Transcript_20975/m.44272 type:complete len:97 (+) Transcript_20975:386-676(+)